MNIMKLFGPFEKDFLVPWKESSPPLSQLALVHSSFNRDQFVTTRPKQTFTEPRRTHGT
jgi:hypothetical protein